MKNHNKSFSEYLKEIKLLPTIPLGVVTFLIGLTSLTLTVFPDLKNSTILDEFWSTETVKNILYTLNLSFSLYVIIIAGSKFRMISEKNIEGEFRYYNFLALSKGSNPSESKPSDWIKFKKGVNGTVRQFMWFWIFCWLFYAINYFLRLKGVHNEPVMNTLNNLGSLMFVFLFLTLTVSTADRGVFTWILFGGLTLLISSVEFQFNETPYIFSILSGLFGCIAFGMFIGSIDSKFANIPLWLIILLFLYAGIQPLYFLLDSRVTISIEETNTKSSLSLLIPTILAFALILKIILFWAVSWLITSDRLLFTICEEGSLNYQRNKNFEKFQEIVSTQKQTLK